MSRERVSVTTAPARHRVIVTAAPGAVFLRLSGSVVEMTPVEALQVAEQLLRCAKTALVAKDGAALERLMATL